MSKSLLSRKELAEDLGVSITTVDRKVRAGEWPFVKVGARILFNPSKIVSLLEQETEADQKAAAAENAEREAKKAAKVRSAQIEAFRSELEEKLQTKTAAEFSDQGRKDFARKWPKIREEASQEMLAKATALHDLIARHREEHPKAFSDRVMLGSMQIPTALRADFTAAWKAELAKLDPVVSAEKALQAERPLRKLTPRQFQTLSQAAAAVSNHVGEVRNFGSLAKAQEAYNALVAAQS